MSPSIYLACTIEDDVAVALDEVNKTFLDIEKEADTALATLSARLATLNGNKSAASVLVGSTPNNQVLWTAKEVGQSGNNLKIVYQNKGPDFDGAQFIDRPTSADVIDTTIYITIAVRASDGAIDPIWDVASSVPVWLSNPDVDALVTAAVQGGGTGTPEPTGFLPFTGGVGAPLKDAENAANDIAKQFGHNTYQSLMQSVNIPIVESAADAAAYLESVDDEIVIINKKLFLVEGTNLVGIRQLYNILQQNVTDLRHYLSKMNSAQSVPHVFITQNVSIPTYELVCGELQEIISLVETFRTYNEGLVQTAERFTEGAVESLNSYIFWMVTAKETMTSYKKLSLWGYPDEYIDFILGGETPVIEDYYGYVQPPTVNVIPEPTIFDTLKFTDDEIKELLDKDVPGIRIPAEDDAEKVQEKLNDLTKFDRPYLPNGMRTKVKKPIAAMQAVDVNKTSNTGNLGKELSTRGAACARLGKNMGQEKFDPVGMLGDAINTYGDKAADYLKKSLSNLPKYISPNLPDMDLPNMPSVDLPDFAKKVESAFGALSSVVSSATRLYDRLVNKLLGVVSSVINKLQNLMSLTDNLLNNSLVKCLLGSSTNATGQPELPEVGSGLGGGGGTGGGGSISIGGIPIPMALLKDALIELNDTLDATVTSAFESVTKLIEKPMCMVTSMLDDLLGFNLGAELNPCKSSKNADQDCPPDVVQDVINASDELSTIYDSLPQSEIFPKTSVVEEVNEQVENFTGKVTKTVESVTQEITRGINDVMNDLTKAMNNSIDTLDKFTKAVKQLIGEDVNESAKTIEEESASQQGCAPPSIGALTDAISAVL